MADAAEVDFLVEEKIAQMDEISTTALEGAQEFLDGMLGSMPRPTSYSFFSQMPLDMLGDPIEADEPDRPNIENLVDSTAIPTTEAVVIPTLPDDADTELPDKIILETIAIPEDISVGIIPFPADLEFPVDTMTDSDVQPFDYTESEYRSTLQDELKNRFIAELQEGSTGLTEDAEEAIYTLRDERDEDELVEAIQRLKDEWSQNLFGLPNGSLQADIDDLYDKYTFHKLDKAREVQIKQFDLTQTNTHFNITSSLALESSLLQHADNVANRALDASKSVVNLGIALFNVQLNRYQVSLEAYKTAVQVYSEELRAEGLKVANYTAQMGGAKIKAEVQGQRLDNYRAQVAAVGEIYNNYKVQVDAAGVKANVETEKLRAFKIQVEAEVDKVRALVAIYEADTSRYRTNVTKGATDSELKLKQQDLISRNYEGDVKIALEAARMNLDSLAKNAQMKINASLGGARNYSLLAGAAMDSINSVVQLGSTASVSATE